MKQEQKNQETNADKNIQNETKVDQVTDLTNTLKRLQAEFENYRKRIEKDNVQIKEHERANILLEVLSIIDNFESAIRTAMNDKSLKNNPITKGFELIYLQLNDLLKRNDVKSIEVLGKKFDPFMHEVVISEDSQKEKNVILAEVQKGYTIKDKLLRPAKVNISRGKKEVASNNTEALDETGNIS